jgi:putative tryptophan/tyrosine transport system substrate-binding protein
MRRRDFIAAVGGAGIGGVAGWPLAVRAQRRPLPVIGVLTVGGVATVNQALLPAFMRGLSENGYVEGRNVAIDYRNAGTRLEDLPGLAADLVRRHVALIFAASTAAAQAAKAVTSSTPIVFVVGSDPVEIGLVASLNRPGGNITGCTSLNFEVAAKRLELLRDLVPDATKFAFLVDPTNGVPTEIRDLQVAARTLGVQLLVLDARNQSEIEAAFGSLGRERVGGLMVAGDTVFAGNIDLLVLLAARDRLPTVYAFSELAMAGGLMSYGNDRPPQWRLAGSYAGRILKGEKPGDLPVQRATKIELVINLKTARVMGITFPLKILARADTTIE